MCSAFSWDCFVVFREGRHTFAWRQFSRVFFDVCNKLAEAFFPDTKAFFGDTKAFFAKPCSRQVSQRSFLKENALFDGND